MLEGTRAMTPHFKHKCHPPKGWDEEHTSDDSYGFLVIKEFPDFQPSKQV